MCLRRFLSGLTFRRISRQQYEDQLNKVNNYTTTIQDGGVEHKVRTANRLAENLLTSRLARAGPLHLPRVVRPQRHPPHALARLAGT